MVEEREAIEAMTENIRRVRETAEKLRRAIEEEQEEETEVVEE